jgi:hypothetical protein
VVTSDETYRQMAAKALVGSLLFIDGVAWTRCNEPKLRATRKHSGEGMISVDVEFDNALSKRAYGNHQRSRVCDTDLFFNLADHEVAKAVLSNRGVRQWPTVGGVQQVVVHAFDQFDFDGHGARIKATAREVVRHLRQQIGEMDAATAQDWLTLRDSVEGTNAIENDALNDLISCLLPHIRGKVEAAELGDDFALTQYIADLRDTRQGAVNRGGERRRPT